MATKAERIAKAEERIAQLQNEKKRLIQQQKEQERKARTKRLIERGAILESLVSDAEVLTNDQIKVLLERTVGSSYGVKVVDSIKSQNGVVSAQRAEVTQEEES